MHIQNKMLLVFFLKVAMQGADLMSRGKAFQTAGADERKARPAITVFVRKALRRLVSPDERSSRRGTQRIFWSGGMLAHRNPELCKSN